MFKRVVLRRGGAAEAESPFWISFSDLMTALMVMFLIVMAVTLLSVTRSVTQVEDQASQRDQDIRELMATIAERSRSFPEVKVDESTYRIDLGDVVRFDSGRATISAQGARLLRAYVPILLRAQEGGIGQRWIRRIIVEGFTDQDGSYLYNLGLSLERSRQVACVLFAPPQGDEAVLSAHDRRLIRDLFMVGGYAYNSAKSSKEASRRVELKVDFWSADDVREAPPVADDKDPGQC